MLKDKEQLPRNAYKGFQVPISDFSVQHISALNGFYNGFQCRNIYTDISRKKFLKTLQRAGILKVLENNVVSQCN